MKNSDFIELAKNCFVHKEFKDEFVKMGLSSVDSVFYFNSGKNLYKDNLGGFRTRIEFETKYSHKPFFLKRYNNTPILFQLKNWIDHLNRKATGLYDISPTNKLAQAGIKTPKAAAFGYKWGWIFEKRSFVITEKIPEGVSLEKKLPDCFNQPSSAANIKLKKDFINQFSDLIKKFHQTGFRHGDLYLCHIFLTRSGEFYLIDLARCFKPILLSRRYQIKDIAQLHYSCPKKYFSKTDRLRFYYQYKGINKLTKADKTDIHNIYSKALKITRHDKKYGRAVPFME